MLQLITFAARLPLTVKEGRVAAGAGGVMVMVREVRTNVQSHILWVDSVNTIEPQIVGLTNVLKGIIYAIGIYCQRYCYGIDNLEL